MSTTHGRSGRPWRRTRRLVFATYGRICHICRHDIEPAQPGEVDHWPLTVDELRAAGLDPNNPAHCRPAHGTSSRCRVCLPGHGWACNQRGRGPASTFDNPAPSVGTLQKVTSTVCYCGEIHPLDWLHVDPASL